MTAFNCRKLRPFCEQLVESCGRGPDSGWSTPAARWHSSLGPLVRCGRSCQFRVIFGSRFWRSQGPLVLHERTSLVATVSAEARRATVSAEARRAKEEGGRRK